MDEKLKMPLVSVIVPIYNLESYVGICLESIINQTYQNLQIIVVNDGSSDSSLQVLERYQQIDGRIKIINQQNAGVSVARNRALDETVGQYVMFVDGDDWIDATMVETLLNLCIGYNADAACCNAVFEDPKRGDKRYSFSNFEMKILKDESILRAYLLGQNLLSSVCGRLYKLDVLKYNTLTFEEGLKIGEDGFFSLQFMAYAKSVVIISDAFYHVLVRPSSVTRFHVRTEISEWNAFAFKEYLESNSLWNLHEMEYRAWYIRAANSHLYRLALLLSYKEYKKYWYRYSSVTKYLYYNQFKVRRLLGRRNSVLAFLGKSAFFSYWAMWLYRHICGRVLY